MKRQRIICLFLAMMLCVSTSCAFAEWSRDEWYKMGLNALDGMTANQVADAVDYFENAGGYEQAPDFLTYAEALSCVFEADELDEDTLYQAEYQLHYLSGKSDFAATLTERSLPSCEDLIQYLHARQLQRAGNAAGAWHLYHEIDQVLDSQRRCMELAGAAYEQGKEALAREDYQTAADALKGLKWRDSDTLYQQAMTALSIPASADITVTYKTDSGITLGTETITVPTGSSQTVYAKDFDGYVKNDSSQTVTVNAQGIPNLLQVTFLYTADKVEAQTTTVSSENTYVQQYEVSDGQLFPYYYTTYDESMIIPFSENTYEQEYEAFGGQPITVLVTLDENGAIVSLYVDATTQTMFLGSECADSTFTSQFIGKSGEVMLGNGIEAVSGATITSTAVVRAVNQVLKKAANAQSGPVKSKIQVGDYITFGHYPQTESGTDNTPIEWLVLHVDTANHQALVISRYGLDSQPYNTKDENITWETCSLCKWLNNDFLNAAFSVEEQKSIISFGNDRVSLLSAAEAKQYFDIESEERISTRSFPSPRVTPTAYAIAQDADSYILRGIFYQTSDGKESWPWWLRSAGASYIVLARSGSTRSNPFSVDLVNDDGTIVECPVDWKNLIRPALWIDLNAGTF